MDSGAKGAGTPLIGRTPKYFIARYVAIISAFGACALIAVVMNSQHRTQEMLAQTGVKYYYVPKAAVRNNKLPLHLMIPQGKGKAVEYTLVAAPLSQLEGNETAPAAAPPPAAANGTSSSSFVCSLANIKEHAAKVFAAWDKCVSAPDYKQPNADAKRRLLSIDSTMGKELPARTQNLKWVWVPAKGEPVTAPPRAPRSWTASMWQMLDGNATAAPAPAAGGGATNLKPCEAAATGPLCSNLAGCKDPVCANYYNDPDVERICGVCTMAASGWFGCFAGHSPVTVRGRGEVRLDEVRVGDMVQAADAGGVVADARVYFIHDHAAPAPTLQLKHDHGVLELTPLHSLPVFTAECGDRLCGAARLVHAKTVRAGDVIYAKGPAGIVATPVLSVSTGVSPVRYVLTETANIIAGGAVASVLSTAAGPLEILPFAVLDKVWPGALQLAPVAAALYTILESPALRHAEAALDRVASAAKHLVDWHSRGTAPAWAARGLSLAAPSA